MKTMLLIDLVTMRRPLARICLSLLLVGLFIAFAARDLMIVMLTCGTMLPYMYLSSIFSEEERNGWAQYRLTLPLTRRQAVAGRYLSVLAVTLGAFAALFLISCGAIALLQPHASLPFEAVSPSDLAMVMCCGIALLLAGISLFMPFVIRLGFTRGSRAVALALVMLPFLLISIFGSTIVDGLDSFLSGAMPMMLVAGTLVLYALSALLSVRLYETREL